MWKRTAMTQDAGLTIEEKRAFVAHTLAQEAKFRASLRRITDSADNRMRTRCAKEVNPPNTPDDKVPPCPPSA